MARPVKITNIGTRNHAQKLKRALRRTYPGWDITVERQDDGKLSLAATPPATQSGRSGLNISRSAAEAR